MAVMREKAHTDAVFRNFPWEKLDDYWFKNQGGCNRGGITDGVDFNTGSRWGISFYDEEGNEERWMLPPQLYRPPPWVRL